MAVEVLCGGGGRWRIVGVCGCVCVSVGVAAACWLLVGAVVYRFRPATPPTALLEPRSYKLGDLC